MNPEEKQKTDYIPPQPTEQQRELYKVATTYQKIRTVISGFIMGLFVLGFISLGIYLFAADTNTWPLLAFSILFGLIYLLIIWQSKKSLFRKHDLQPTPSKPFDAIGMAEVKTQQTYSRAGIEEGETILAWAGPVTRGDMKGQGISLGVTEFVSGAENTLMLTNKRLICMTFTQVDFNNVTEGGNVLTAFAGLDTIKDTAREEHDELFMMNASKWPHLIEGLRQYKLKDVADSHYNFAIPFASIAGIEKKQRFFNAGVFINLKDGTVLKYSFGMKDNKQAIESFAAQAQSLGVSVK